MPTVNWTATRIRPSRRTSSRQLELDSSHTPARGGEPDAGNDNLGPELQVPRTSARAIAHNQRKNGTTVSGQVREINWWR